MADFQEISPKRRGNNLLTKVSTFYPSIKAGVQTATYKLSVNFCPISVDDKCLLLSRVKKWLCGKPLCFVNVLIEDFLCVSLGS